MRAGAQSAAPSFVAYYRVSTAQQGRSGLGLDAQREAVTAHVRRQSGRIVAEYTEIESGKRNDRPEIAKAIAAARARRATLIIAKLDRLARNVAFISSLMDSGVEFLAADMPLANRLTVHILAAVAEHEREMISARTKAALAAAKARGTKLGGPNLRSGDRTAQRAGRRMQSARSKQRHTDLMPHVLDAQRTGAKSLREIAAKLTAWSIAPPSGGDKWHAAQVRRVLKGAATA